MLAAMSRQLGIDTADVQPLARSRGRNPSGGEGKHLAMLQACGKREARTDRPTARTGASLRNLTRRKQT